MIPNYTFTRSVVFKYYKYSKVVRIHTFTSYLSYKNRESVSIITQPYRFYLAKELYYFVSSYDIRAYLYLIYDSFPFEKYE